MKNIIFSLTILFLAVSIVNSHKSSIKNDFPQETLILWNGERNFDSHIDCIGEGALDSTSQYDGNYCYKSVYEQWQPARYINFFPPYNENPGHPLYRVRLTEFDVFTFYIKADYQGEILFAAGDGWLGLSRKMNINDFIQDGNISEVWKQAVIPTDSLFVPAGDDSEFGYKLERVEFLTFFNNIDGTLQENQHFYLDDVKIEKIYPPEGIIKEITTAYNNVFCLNIETGPDSMDIPPQNSELWQINGVSPVQTGRESFPIEIGIDREGYGENAQMIHKIYLEMPQNFEENSQYLIHTPYYGDTLIVFNSEEIRCESIKINQGAYNLNSRVRYGNLGVYMGDLGIRNFETPPDYKIIDDTGYEIYSGTSVYWGDDSEETSEYSGEYVYRLDLSPILNEGVYKIVIPGLGCSYPIKAGTEYFGEISKTVFRGLYHQRCGIPLEEEFTPYSRDICHTEVMVTDGIPDGFVFEESSQIREIHGGYHDAGDFDRRRSHTVIPIFLLNTYEAFKDEFQDYDAGIPDFFHYDYSFTGNTSLGKDEINKFNHIKGPYSGDDSKIRTNNVSNIFNNNGASASENDSKNKTKSVPYTFKKNEASTFGYGSENRTNSIPDILNEALWGVLLYEYLQDIDFSEDVQDGGVRAGTETTTHPQYGYDSADNDPLTYKTYCKDGHTTASAAGMFAQTARLLNDLLPQLEGETYDFVLQKANTLSGRALVAWGYLTAPENAEEMESASPTVRMYAALQIYLLTGNESFHQLFLQYFETAYNGSWPMQYHSYAISLDYIVEGMIWPDYFISYLLTDEEKDKSVSDQMRYWILDEAQLGLESCDNLSGEMGKPYPIGFPWGGGVGFGSGTNQGRYGQALWYAYKLTGQLEYIDALSQLGDYTLGLNPKSVSYITGLGYDVGESPLHLDSYFTKERGLGNVPGITVYGFSNGVGYMGYNVYSRCYPDIDFQAVQKRWCTGHSIVEWNEFTTWETMTTNALMYSVLSVLGDDTDIEFEDSEDFIEMTFYPNPFREKIEGELYLKEGSEIEISVYNIRGQLVKRIDKGSYKKGKHIIQWCGDNRSGDSVSSGIYFIRVKSDNFEKNSKILMLK